MFFLANAIIKMTFNKFSYWIDIKKHLELKN